jgi:hypothetical protein
MVMFRSLFFTGALLAAGAACAQEVAISGKDFLSGAGDAKIAELARQAAASGKTLLISAPPYWQDKAASKVHAGAANATVRMSDAFFENVMVRVEDSKASTKTVEAPAPPPAPKAAPPRPEPKPVEPKPAPPMAKPAPVETPVAPKPAPVEAPPPPPVKTEVVPAPAPAPAAAPPPVVTPPPAPASAAKAPADPSIAIKQRMTQNLNAGQPAEGTLQVAQLQKDDLLFVDGPVRAVVRRFGPRTQLFWVEGELNLERAELVPTGNDRYRINEPIRNVANPSLRGSSKGGTLKFTFNVPAPKSPARVAIERQYNDSRNIDANLTPVDLRQGDLVYTGEGSAVVVRRTSSGVQRYWLVGELDLHQSGLQTQGNAIRVLTDTVK